MSTLTKMALAAFAGLLLGGGALAVAGDSANDRTVSETTTVETVGTTSGDVSGPCDEAEHANDPRCDGPQRPEDNGNVGNAANGVDISGPCDEAEHANDPRCTGQVGDREDNSGPGNARDDDRDREDNSGPGSANSGPGNAHDDDDDDHSGSGHSGSGSSGSGSSHSGGSDDD